LLAENPAVVERYLRAIARGREFARRNKEIAVAMVAKYNPLPAEALAVDYDSALMSMTDEGSVTDDILRDEVAARAELIKAPKVSDLSKIFDYSIIRRVYAELKKPSKPKL
jgi:ABC-type nitrate/sulfonate/bicarbonate transport system substrate-binding protein